MAWLYSSQYLPAAARKSSVQLPSHDCTAPGLGETACHWPVAGEYNSGTGWPGQPQLKGTHGRSGGSRVDG
jgi:hypothetical protein